MVEHLARILCQFTGRQQLRYTWVSETMTVTVTKLHSSTNCSQCYRLVGKACLFSAWIGIWNCRRLLCSDERSSGGSAFQTTGTAMVKLRWPTNVFARVTKNTSRRGQPNGWPTWHAHLILTVCWHKLLLNNMMMMQAAKFVRTDQERVSGENKKAQLSLRNQRDAKACQLLHSTCLQRCRWQYWSIFIRSAVGPSEICEIRRNSLKIQTYSCSRSSKVIDLGANRKRICTFLLVTNGNFGRISYRFRDIDTFSSKLACFSYLYLVWRPLAAERHKIST